MITKGDICGYSCSLYTRSKASKKLPVNWVFPAILLNTICTAGTDANVYSTRTQTETKLVPFEPYLIQHIQLAKPDWIPATILFDELLSRGISRVQDCAIASFRLPV